MKFKLTEEDIDRVHEVAWATSKDEARPQLGAVQLSLGWAMGTDSYRLAAVELDDFDAEEPVWLSRAAIHDLPASGDCTITVRQDRRNYQECSWHVGGRRVVHELWVGEREPINWYPLTGKPVGQTLQIKADARSDLVVAVRACKTKSKPVVLRSTWAHRLRVEGPERTENLSTGIAGGFLVPIGLNPRFLLDFLARHAPGLLTVHCGTPLPMGPLMATDAHDVVHLLMPVRLHLKVEWGTE